MSPARAGPGDLPKLACRRVVPRRDEAAADADRFPDDHAVDAVAAGVDRRRSARVNAERGVVAKDGDDVVDVVLRPRPGACRCREPRRGRWRPCRERGVGDAREEERRGRRPASSAGSVPSANARSAAAIAAKCRCQWPRRRHRPARPWPDRRWCAGPVPAALQRPSRKSSEHGETSTSVAQYAAWLHCGCNMNGIRPRSSTPVEGQFQARGASSALSWVQRSAPGWPVACERCAGRIRDAYGAVLLSRLRSLRMTPGTSSPLSCPDRPGIVAAVASYLASSGCNITESQQFDDRRTGQFFMRVNVEAVGRRPVARWVARGIRLCRTQFGMEWSLWDARAPYRTLIMVSKFGHCLNDLLYRWKSGALNMEIPAIVSNHPDMEPLCAVLWHSVSPHSGDSRHQARAESALLKLVATISISTSSCSRAIRSCHDETATRMSGESSTSTTRSCRRSRGQALSPGVRAGSQARGRDGALCHRGPRRGADHRAGRDPCRSPDGRRQIVRAGEEVEAQVLTRALRWHCDSRVFLAGDRTVVFG